jgi:hypothetical protein
MQEVGSLARSSRSSSSSSSRLTSIRSTDRLTSSHLHMSRSDWLAVANHTMVLTMTQAGSTPVPPQVRKGTSDARQMEMIYLSPLEHGKEHLP